MLWGKSEELAEVHELACYGFGCGGVRWGGIRWGLIDEEGAEVDSILGRENSIMNKVMEVCNSIVYVEKLQASLHHSNLRGKMKSGKKEKNVLTQMKMEIQLTKTYEMQQKQF